MSSSDTVNAKPQCRLSNDVLLVNIPREPDEKWIAATESAYPGFKVRWVTRRFKDNEQRRPEDFDIPPDAWEGVTMLCTFTPQPASLMSHIRYVQLTSAGADKWIDHEKYKDPDVVFCTANGTHSPQIAEWVIGTWLMMSHRFLDFAHSQKEGKWQRDWQGVQDSPGLRMGILGYGAIGRQCARLASAMGMEVYAYTRSERATPETRRDDSFCLPGLGDPDGVIPTRWFHGASRAAINEFLAQDLDILVVSLPLTEATRNVIGREQFDILARKRTFLSNIARGKHVDTDALLEALRGGKIRGAALDVTDPEPLPDGHPLYSAPNVFITPHVSWATPHYFERILAILGANLERLNKGEPMLNVMNREHHY